MMPRLNKSMALRWAQPAASQIVHIACGWIAATRLDLHVEGLHRVPPHGPVLLVSRHYHYSYDGVILLGLLRRPVRILIALDWVPNRLTRFLLERVTGFMHWPVVLRANQIAARDARGPYRPGEERRYLITALKECHAALARGDVLLMFPEAYPNVDPMPTAKTREEFLPLKPGIIHVIRRAQRAAIPVTVVPVGLHYKEGKRWQVGVRFGDPIVPSVDGDAAELLAALDRTVRELSRARDRGVRDAPV